MFRTRGQRLLGAAVVVVVVLGALGAAGWWFFIRDDAPKAPSLETASKTLDEAGDGSSSSSDASSDASDLDGTWNVDTSLGSFDKFTSTYAGYRVKEQLAGIGAATAVGRTPDVSGSITIDGGKVSKGSFEVDMTTLKSDKDLRDNAIKSRGLETATYPKATFELTDPVVLPAAIASVDTKVPFAATGDLTIHGVTKEVTLDFDAQRDNDTIAVVGKAPIKLADYGMTPPTNGIALSVSDSGTLEFQVFLTKG
jgi:polyisoprenoid-binding protein YceI